MNSTNPTMKMGGFGKFKQGANRVAFMDASGNIGDDSSFGD